MTRNVFLSHRGTILPLPEENIDTDQIVPARYLMRPRKEGYSDTLFADLRRDADGKAIADFVMNIPPFDCASVLVAYGNFGCGSSREHAVWALQDGGIQVVIAPSFGDIFFNNAVQNGLLLLTASMAQVDDLLGTARANPSSQVEVNLPEQTVRYGDQSFHFEIEAHRKQVLLKGLSEIDATLRDLDAIKAFEKTRLAAEPWLANPIQPEQPRGNAA